MDPAPAISEVEGNESAIRCINPRTRRGRGKRGISTSIDSLPDDLLFDILVRVPAHDIHRNARLVCRRWKLLIHGDAFVGAHLRRTLYGLLLFGASTRSHTKGNGNYIFGSCNGLILGTNYSKEDSNLSIFVASPATNQGFDLPRFLDAETVFEDGYSEFGIAYAAASANYKVVAAYVNASILELSRYAILTVGVDTAWRDIAIEHLSPLAEYLLCDYFNVLTTEGFLHWVSSFDNYVLTKDVETEKIAETPVPLELEERRCSYQYMSTGSHLMVLISCDDFLWEVWEMKGGSGEWRRVLPDIDLNAHKSEIYQLGLDDEDILRPVGWVNYPEALLFFPCDRYLYDDKTNSRGIIYNLEGDEINSIELPAPFESCEALVHKNSLVSLRRDLF